MCIPGCVYGFTTHLTFGRTINGSRREPFVIDKAAGVSSKFRTVISENDRRKTSFARFHRKNSRQQKRHSFYIFQSNDPKRFLARDFLRDSRVRSLISRSTGKRKRSRRHSWKDLRDSPLDLFLLAAGWRDAGGGGGGEAGKRIRRYSFFVHFYCYAEYMATRCYGIPRDPSGSFRSHRQKGTLHKGEEGKESIGLIVTSGRAVTCVRKASRNDSHVCGESGIKKKKKEITIHERAQREKFAGRIVIFLFPSSGNRRLLLSRSVLILRGGREGGTAKGGSRSFDYTRLREVPKHERVKFSRATKNRAGADRSSFTLLGALARSVIRPELSRVLSAMPRVRH